MQAIDIFIDENVWESKKKYHRMMMVTKQKFFEYLNDNRALEEYTIELKKLWENVDHTYMNKAIKELEQMVKQKNQEDAQIFSDKKVTQRSIKLQNNRQDYEVKDYEIYKLNPERDFKTLEQRFMNRHIKFYETTQNRLSESLDTENDLKKLVEKYDKLDKNIPYFHKDGTIKCYNTISTYCSMLYNVNLTRSAWNRTEYDGKLLNNPLRYLPAHPYACPCCIAYQGKVYTTDPLDNRYPQKEEAILGGVGHPNCKHNWLLYWGPEQIQDEKWNSDKWEEKYKNKQKYQSLELQKSRLLTDRRIYKNQGNQDLVDITSSKIKKIRQKMKELDF